MRHGIFSAVGHPQCKRLAAGDRCLYLFPRHKNTITQTLKIGKPALRFDGARFETRLDALRIETGEQM